MPVGAVPWSYFVPYRDDVAVALEELKRREFEAGRYLEPMVPHLPATSIEEAVAANDGTGSRSILDMTGVAEAPRNPDHPIGEGEFQAIDFEGDEMMTLVAPLAPGQLLQLYGTERPSRAMIEQDDGYYDLIDRGLGIYIIAHDGDEPSGIFFAGYSFD